VSPDLFDLSPPEALRFHASRKHPSGGVWPTMVALVMNGAYGTSHVSWAAGKRRSFDYGAEQPFRLFVVAQRRNCCPDCLEQMRLSSAPCDAMWWNFWTLPTPLASAGAKRSAGDYAAIAVPLWMHLPGAVRIGRG
jgi:hypothetical protein